MKIYVKDEDQLGKEFCDMINCSGEQPTESDNTGCTGCDACDKYFDNNFNRVVSESDKDTFLALDEVRQWLKSEIHRSGAPTQMLEEFDKSVTITKSN